MTTKSDFGLVGVASKLQYGKAGGKVTYNPANNTFNITLADETTFANIKADTITLQDGDVIITSPVGKLTISQSSLSLDQEGVFKFNGTKALSIPVGTTEERPVASALGMVRINSTTADGVVPFLEYYDGTNWVQVGAQISPEYIGTAPINVAVTGDNVTLSLQTVPVAFGGTGNILIPKDRIPYGNNADPLGNSAGFTYDDTTKKLTVGTEFPVQIDGAASAIKAGTENGDLFLLPNGTGHVILGGVGQTLLTAGSGESLAVKALSASLVLESEGANTVMQLTAGTTNKVTVSGPTAAEYAEGLGAGDLVNKYYVDNLVNAVNGGSF